MIQRAVSVLRRTLLSGLVVAWVGVCAPLSAYAHDHAQLIHYLESSRDFRVRVQAAFSAGKTGDVRLRPHLERALADRHPAVRAAAATALGKLGDAAAISALESARSDKSSAVRTQASQAIAALSRRPIPSGGPTLTATVMVEPASVLEPRTGPIRWRNARYVVVLGELTNRTGKGHAGLVDRFQRAVVEHLERESGVIVFRDERELNPQAQSEIRRRRLPFVRLEGNVSKVERTMKGREVWIRCEVRLLLLDAKDRNIRSTFQGAASSAELRRRDRKLQDRALGEQAVSGAVQGALSSVGMALARAQH